MQLDLRRYEEALQHARLQLAIPTFDPRKHPRTPSGQFRRLFHATDAELSPGDTILPSSKGFDSNTSDMYGNYSPDHVYAFDARHGASAQQDFGEHVYEIQAMTNVVDDPEKFEDEYGDADDSWMTKRAKVLRKLDPAEIQRLKAGKLSRKTVKG